MSRQLFTFNGGVHPEGHKAESNATPIRPMPLLPRYVVPLRQHIGQPGSGPWCKTGDRGAARSDDRPAGRDHLHGRACPDLGHRFRRRDASGRPSFRSQFGLCVVIEADGEDRSIDFQPLDWRKLDPSALRNRIREMGLAGLGGAVFPSYIKLNP
jgi:electron transport complex protein RnfC